MTDRGELHKWAQYHDPEFPEYNTAYQGEDCDCYGCRQLRRVARNVIGYEDREWTDGEASS